MRLVVLCHGLLLGAHQAPSALLASQRLHHAQEVLFVISRRLIVHPFHPHFQDSVILTRQILSNHGHARLVIVTVLRAFRLAVVHRLRVDVSFLFTVDPWDTCTLKVGVQLFALTCLNEGFTPHSINHLGFDQVTDRLLLQ